MWNVAQTRPQDWAYLAEGGSTVVFSYAGPAHPHFTGKILRLRKTSTSRHTGDEGDDTVAFQNTVIAALVPSQFLPDLESVHLDATWLATLEALQSGDRPPQWRAKDQIDKTRQKGILATDLVRGQDVLAIEIKVRSDSLHRGQPHDRSPSPSGVSCPIPRTCPRRLQRSRRPRAGFACMPISSSKTVTCLPNIVPWISTRKMNHACGRLSAIFGTAGCRATVLSTI